MEKILVIEDEKNIRASIIEILQLYGYMVVFAENGRTGIKIVKEENPDLIVCDIMMPEMDGFAVLKELHIDPDFNTPFIFLTAVSEYQNLRDGMNLGADDYIFKPFKSADLVQTIKTRLSRRSKTANEIQQKTNNLEKLINLMVGHEFNTPMNGIISMSKFIKENLDKLEYDKLDDYFKYLDISTNRLQATFNKIKQLYEIQIIRNDDDTENEVCKTEYLIRLAAENITKEQNRKRDLIIDNVEDIILPVKTNLFYSALYEIIENAFKFSSEGQKVQISSKKIDNKYQVIVSDAGSKISAKELSTYRTFQQFNREKYEQQGLGVGLALTIGILEFYKGSVSFLDYTPNGISAVLIFKV